MADPEDVDAVDGGDLVHRREAGGGLDLDEHERLGVLLLERRRDARRLPLVGEEHAEPSPPDRREAGRVDHEARLLDALDGGHHHAHRTQVEPARDQVVGGVGDAEERNGVGAARGREDVAHPLDAVARVLEVEERELRARGRSQARDRGRRELRHHRAEHHFARREPPPDRIVPHRLR